jgi:hypothetical protein
MITAISMMKAQMLRNTLLMFFTFKFFGCEHIVQSKPNHAGNGVPQIIKNHHHEHRRLVVPRFIESNTIYRATANFSRM